VRTHGSGLRANCALSGLRSMGLWRQVGRHVAPPVGRSVGYVSGSGCDALDVSSVLLPSLRCVFISRFYTFFLWFRAKKHRRNVEETSKKHRRHIEETLFFTFESIPQTTKSLRKSIPKNIPNFLEYRSRPLEYRSWPLEYRSWPLEYRSWPLEYRLLAFGVYVFCFETALKLKIMILEYRSWPLEYRSWPLEYRSWPLEYRSRPLEYRLLAFGV
jgi:hypothetical protein